MSETTTAGTLPDANPDQAPDQADASPAQRKPGPTAAEAKLLKEVMRYKADKQALAAKLAAFGDLDLAKVKELTERAATAERARQDAEIERQKALGNWDAYKEQIVAQHRAELETARSQLTNERAALAAQFERQTVLLNELTVGSAFNSSAFIKDETILTASKARKAYEDHFDVEHGKVVAYDAPRGDADRLPLVDASGEAMSFETALRRIADADPDRDALLRSSRKVQAAQSAPPPAHIAAGVDRLARAVADGALPKSAALIERANAHWASQPGTLPQGASQRDLGVDRIAKGLNARANVGR